MKPAAFPRSARLLAGRDFRRVFRAGRCESNGMFRIHTAARVTTREAENGSAGCSAARIGMAVSRRTAGNAVVRNRIRRQIRETFRRHRTRLPDRDFVVVARSPAAKADKATLRRALEELWLRFESK